MGQLKRREEKRWEARGSNLAPLFMFLLFRLSLPYVNWASQEGCLLHLRFSLWSSDLPLFYFHRPFPFFVFEPWLVWTPFSYCNYLTIPFKCFLMPCCVCSCSVMSDSLSPMDCRLPVSSVHGIPQARTLEWVAISFSRESSWPRDQTSVSCTGMQKQADSLLSEPPGKQQKPSKHGL